MNNIFWKCIEKQFNMHGLFVLHFTQRILRTSANVLILHRTYDINSAHVLNLLCSIWSLDLVPLLVDKRETLCRLFLLNLSARAQQCRATSSAW